MEGPARPPPESEQQLAVCGRVPKLMQQVIKSSEYLQFGLVNCGQRCFLGMARAAFGAEEGSATRRRWHPC
jgi:hypothetical protein